MELEELDTANLIAPHHDVEPLADWAERNGVSFHTARGWSSRGYIPTLKFGKLRMVNTTLLRAWLLEQEWR